MAGRNPITAKKRLALDISEENTIIPDNQESAHALLIADLYHERDQTLHNHQLSTVFLPITEHDWKKCLKKE